MLKKYLEKNSPLAAALITLAVCLLVFRDVLSGSSLYLFAYGAASDSISYGFPENVFFSNLLRDGGILSNWSFNFGLGKAILFKPLSPGGTLSLFPPWAIPYASGFIVTAHAVLSGLFFCLYLREVKVSPAASVAAAVQFAFCGHFIVRSPWLFTLDTFLLAFFLYSFEKFYSGKSGRLLPLSIALFPAVYHFSYLYFLGLPCLLYMFGRYLADNVLDLKGLLKYAKSLAAPCAAGIGLSAVFLFPAVHNFLGTSRGLLPGALPGGPADIFAFNGGLEMLTALARSFSSDILGVRNFYGSDNYFEAPVFYAGLAAVLLVPQLLFLRDRRKVKVFLGALALAALYVIFREFRLAFNAFSHQSWRFSAWITAAALIIYSFSLDGLFRYVEGRGAERQGGSGDETARRALCLCVVAGAVYFVLALLRIAVTGMEREAGGTSFSLLSVFVSLYLALLLGYLYSGKPARGLFKAAFLLLVIAEAAWFSACQLRGAAGDRLAKKDLGKFYDQDVARAARRLKAFDGGFYRVLTEAHGVHLNVGQLYGYNGVALYNLEISKEQLGFYSDFGLPVRLGGRQLLPFNDRHVLTDMLSAKYYIGIAGNEPVPPGYEYLFSENRVKLYRNRNFIPFGFASSQVLPYGEFKKLRSDGAGPGGKDSLTIKSPVVMDEDLEAVLKAAPALGSAKSASGRAAMSVAAAGSDSIRGSILLKEDSFLFFSVPRDKGWLLKVNGEPRELVRANVGFMGVPLKAGSHSVLLEYSLPWLRPGLAVSLLSLAVLLLFGPGFRAASGKRAG